MARLDEIQSLFFRAIQWPSGVGDFLKQADEETREEFAQCFDDSEAFGRVERLDVYANAYFHRLLGALVEMLPRVVFFLGDAQFHNLITDYVLACPSTCGDLRRYADALPEYLRCHPVGRQSPHLIQIAQVELALSDALDAKDAPVVTLGDLGAVPIGQWPGLRFSLAPAARIVSTDFCWEDLDNSWRLKQRTIPETGPLSQAVLVARRRHAVVARTMRPEEAVALRAIHAGLTFGEACERVAEVHPECEPAALVGFVQLWLEHEVLVRDLQKPAQL